MLRSILIVSWDQTLLDTRVLVLRSRGLAALGAESIDDALTLAKSVQPSVGIICHTLSESEQSTFLDALIRVCPNIFIMRLRQGEVKSSSPCRRLCAMLCDAGCG
jgi:ActR/RegA family two-component response regulator